MSRPGEVAGFIRALSGATGPIYDFLAEEVLTRLSPLTQRILMHASLVDRVRAQYVAAALEANDAGDDLPAIGSALDEAEALGLLGGRTGTSSGRRMHPLFREFVGVHLERDVPATRIRAMHLAIAREAESDDWLTAARHYARAEEDGECMRVLGSAASEALGTGAWGAAVEILDLLSATDAPPAVRVIRARALISDEHLEDALDLLAGIDRSDLDAEERGLVGLTCAAIYHLRGERQLLIDEVDAIADDERTPQTLREVAVAWRHLLDAAGGSCISDAVQLFRKVAASQASASLHYYAGVTLHITATAELARGNYEEARRLAEDSMAHLGQTDVDGTITASTRSLIAMALAETGQIEEALRIATAVATDPSATADSIAEAAHLHAVCGRDRKARSLVARFERGDARWAGDPTSQAVGCYARAAVFVAAHDHVAARRELATLRRIPPMDFDARSRMATLESLLAVVERTPDAKALALRAVQVCTSQNAWRWAARARILDAVARRDGEALALWIGEAESESSLAVLELADALATAIGTLAPLPEALERSMLREPARWVAALSRELQGPPGDDASAAASLVARFGTAEEVPLLRDFDRAAGGKRTRRGTASQLVRRVSPTVRVHDLGLSSYEVGERRVTLTETRRKPAGLLLFMVTRRGLGATKELVMESLWPDQTPKSALNSLHQTIFFLRRDIEPWYEDGATADYIHLEGELVRLDAELFQIDSVSFSRQASDILSTRTELARGPELLALYKGRFAPEFEYEEWAEEWRTHLHASFLHLAHATSNALLVEHRFGEAVEVLTPVASLDPTAYDLRATLVACLAATGATDAAHAHYRSMAVSQERDIGVPARSFDEIVASILDP